jgi:hypothetical protein
MSQPDDTDARRLALYAKRDELRAQQAARMEQRRREALVEGFRRWHGEWLDEAAFPHEVLWPWDAPPAGPIGNYAFAFSGIDWQLVPGSVSRYGGIESALKELLDEALEALGIAPACRVHLDWSGGSMPRLVLAAADLSRHAETLMRWGSDLWVFDPDARWIIEIYHEGTLSYAAHPGLPEHAGFHWMKKRR